MLGNAEGIADGTAVGTCVGEKDGSLVGATVGQNVGDLVGIAVGLVVGLGVGDRVGAAVGIVVYNLLILFPLNSATSKVPSVAKTTSEAQLIVADVAIPLSPGVVAPFPANNVEPPLENK